MDLESLAKMKRLIQAGLAEARPDGGYVVKVARESLYNEDDLTHCHPSYNVPSGYDYITVRADQVAEMMAPDFEARLEARVRNVVVDESALLARTRTNRNPIKVEGELVKLISDGSFIRVVTR